jgi:hypothetical protein
MGKSIIRMWKHRGVKSEDYNKLYEKYINTTNCELCNIQFNEDRKYNSWRCLDHDHETGLYRQTICNSCNSKFDVKPRCDNKLGHKYISILKRKINNKYYISFQYARKINNKRITKSDLSLTKLIAFSFIQILKNG